MCWRSIGMLGILGVALAQPVAPAHAADAPAPATAAAAPVASGSVLAGLGFGDKPFVLRGEAFTDTMNQLAAEHNKSCSAQESFGWEMGDDAQTHVDKLTGSIMASLKQGHFLVKELKTKLFPSSDQLAPYSADRSDRHLILLFSLSSARAAEQKSQLVLLICDTGTGH